MAQIGARGTTAWRKSSRCDSHQCVEVALGDGAAVRDSASPDRHLSFPAPAWRRFIATLRAA
ncbi:DUF397 domain-containing protein [Micromonospora pattaloongensis]|uniref:DUF397 domain-containing protein n=1 Tax=Micromonospora pattaloongensis TaxID=405436 RepID=UPI000B89093F|nr:DUF397 domain-containing protein [Micromonospora pattaloongensis]